MQPFGKRHKSVLDKNTPIFWLDVLKQWCHYNFVQAEEVGDPKNEILWFNSNIKIENKVVYYKAWHEKMLHTQKTYLTIMEI